MFKNEIRSTTLNTPMRSEVNPPVVNNKSNDMLDKLNLYFGYEVTSIHEFIKEFKSEYEDDHDAVNSLLMFLNSTFCKR